MEDRPIPIDTKEEDPEELTRITKAIRPLIAAAVERTFLSHAYDLMTRPVDYIVPAVWGAKKDEKPDDTQRKINLQIQPLVDLALEVFQGASLDRAQEFFITFLMRELLISKVVYRIELAKNQAHQALEESDLWEEKGWFVKVGHA